ncbi:periplasmic heavy metal sensor [Terricaulis sp.]|uniref:periplasmic heavy metal sensor n=1 Tax=Terricaulis sp. TaxID=2768686 RepID=UPI003782D8C9
MSFPWRTALLVSAGLNLLLIGGAAGAFGAGVRLQRPEQPQAVVERLPGPRAFMQALPEPTRTKVREDMAESWVQTRQRREAALQARRDAFAIMAAEPYNAANVKAAFARLRQADQDTIAVFHDNIADELGTLSPEQRREAMEALRRAAPARRDGVAPRREGGVERPVLTPEERAERRERWRERRQARREERQQQQQQTP